MKKIAILLFVFATALTAQVQIGKGVQIGWGGLTFKGNWSASTTYTFSDAVYYQNSTYVSIQSPNLNQNPSTQTAYWTLLVSGTGAGGSSGSIQYNSGGILGGVNGTGYVKAQGASAPVISSTVPTTDIAYPTATTNQVWQYSGASTVGPGGFLSRLDLANCSTLYLYDEGTGTALHNRCATGSAGDGVTIGSPTWSSYGLVLNANTGTGGQAAQLPVSENTAKTFIIAGYFPTFGTNLGVTWGADASHFPQNGSLLCGTANNLICTDNNNITGEYAAIANSLQMVTPSRTAGTQTLAAQSIPTGNHVVAIVCGTTDGDKYYVDGNPWPMARANNTCPTVTNTGQYQIGGSPLLTKTYVSLLLSASMTFQAALTPTQIAAQSDALFNYMKSRGQVSIPASFPAPNGVASVTCFGDSRTHGIAGNPALCTYLSLDNTSALINTYAFVGQKAYDLCADQDGAQQSTVNVSSNVIDIVWIDINDGGISSGNGPSILSYDRCAIRRLKATGATVLIATEISATGADNIKNYVNGPILNNTWGADGVIALGSAPIIGADGAYANTTYFGDGLHPTTLTNSTVIGVIYSNAINELWGSTANNYNEITSTTYQELAKDGFLRVGATTASAATVTLPDCQGYTKPRTIFNASAFTVTVNPAASGFYASFSETIDGGSSATIPTGTTKVFGIIQGSSTTGGCVWQTIGAS